MKKAELRIGIIGTGRITERFWDECRHVDGVRVAAIYNRHLESVLWLAERKHIDNDGKVLFTNRLDEFYQSVDAVYVASPHEYHVSYTMQALQHDKHVICEKPMAVRKKDVEDIFTLARQKKLVCIEAIKTAYCKGFQKILEIVESGAIGRPRDIDATISKISAAAGREMWTDYGGSFVELGSYALLSVAKIYGIQEEPQINIFSLRGAPRHDSYTKMMLSYEDHVATLKTGLGVKSEGELIIAGDRGYIRVPSPWWLTRHIEVHHEDPNRVENYDLEYECSGLRYEIASFAEMVRGDEAEVSDKSFSHKAQVSGDESKWMAGIMEFFRDEQAKREENVIPVSKEELEKIKIWAHRGCSMAYPENTLLAFKKAAEVENITGIELDTQLTLDGKVVVIHDEKVDRTTDGCGRVCDFTLEELRRLHITSSGQTEKYILSEADRDFIGAEEGEQLSIPTLREVFDILAPYCKNKGLKINIELKNSIIPYEGMEKKVIDIVREYELEDYIVYSSFNHVSLNVVRKIQPEAEIAPLAGDYHDCLEGFYEYKADAIHPGRCGMPVNMVDVKTLKEMKIPVRMWGGEEPLYGQKRHLSEMDLREYCQLGATDIFTNVPEHYKIID